MAEAAATGPQPAKKGPESPAADEGSNDGDDMNKGIVHLLSISAGAETKPESGTAGTETASSTRAGKSGTETAPRPSTRAGMGGAAATRAPAADVMVTENATEIPREQDVVTAMRGGGDMSSSTRAAATHRREAPLNLHQARAHPFVALSLKCGVFCAMIKRRWEFFDLPACETYDRFTWSTDKDVQVS